MQEKQTISKHLTEIGIAEILMIAVVAIMFCQSTIKGLLALFLFFVINLLMAVARKHPFRKTVNENHGEATESTSPSAINSQTELPANADNYQRNEK